MVKAVHCEGSPLLLSFRNFIGLEPAVWNVQRAGVVVRVVWPAPSAVRDLVRPQEGELFSSSGRIALCVAVLNRLACPPCSVRCITSLLQARYRCPRFNTHYTCNADTFSEQSLMPPCVCHDLTSSRLRHCLHHLQCSTIAFMKLSRSPQDCNHEEGFACAIAAQWDETAIRCDPIY